MELWCAVVVLAASASLPTALSVSPELKSSLDESVLVSRLSEEGFQPAPPTEARLLLVVSRDEKGVKLEAVTAAGRLSRLVEAPDEVWATERTFELAQRLAALAHEAAAGLPPEAPSAPPAAIAGSPPPEEEPPPAPVAVSDSSTAPPRFAMTIRPGFILRSGAFDFTAQAMGVLRLRTLEPLLSLGIVVAPDRGGTALEFPLLGGLRVLFAPWEGWTLSPEVVLGLRLHAFLGDEAAVRVDPALQLGLSFRRRLLPHLALGASVAAFLSTARTHVAGLSQVLWDRGSLGLVVGLDVEI
ncbi:MAG: hypothetical protein IT380_12560 [Myxococcales bacterium]|nr:hypothetical protein [Myxococcales bacterium]